MKVSILAAGILMVCAALGVQAQDPAKEKVINGGVLNGKAVRLPKPEYPAHLRDQNKGGSVSVEVVIDESGTVISATAVPGIEVRAGAEGMMAVKKDIDPALVEAAENAAMAAMFSPTLLSRTPVKVKGTIVYNFVPSGGEDIGDDPEAVKGGVLNSKTVSMPLPAYPAAARAVRAEGVVNVLIKISEAGEVVEAQAVSGHPLLRAAAVAAAREARFEPVYRDGQPVKVAGVLVYNFVDP